MVAIVKSKDKLDTPIFDLRAQKTSFSDTVYRDSLFIFFLAMTFISLCVICIFCSFSIITGAWSTIIIIDLIMNSN